MSLLNQSLDIKSCSNSHSRAPRQSKTERKSAVYLNQCAYQKHQSESEDRFQAVLLDIKALGEGIALRSPLRNRLMQARILSDRHQGFTKIPPLEKSSL